MIKLYKEQLEIILGEIKRLEKEHPKANIFFDTERNGIQIVYPLPKDFFTKWKENKIDMSESWNFDKEDREI